MIQKLDSRCILSVKDGAYKHQEVISHCTVKDLIKSAWSMDLIHSFPKSSKRIVVVVNLERTPKPDSGWSYSGREDQY